MVLQSFLCLLVPLNRVELTCVNSVSKKVARTSEWRNQLLRNLHIRTSLVVTWLKKKKRKKKGLASIPGRIFTDRTPGEKYGLVLIVSATIVKHSVKIPIRADNAVK